MKVLLINGSPHKEGCTYTALKEVADTLEKNGIETEFLWVGAKPVAGCIDCGACVKNGKCCFDDDVNKVISMLPEIDGFVVGSPVYYGSASGQVTAFLDRMFFSTFAMKSSYENKLAASVVSCRRGGASATFDQLNRYFVMNNMPLVPSQYWNQVHGMNPDEVRQDLEGLQTMRKLGENMAWLLKCIDAGKKAGVPLPAVEEKTMTNFIR